MFLNYLKLSRFYSGLMNIISVNYRLKIYPVYLLFVSNKDTDSFFKVNLPARFNGGTIPIDLITIVPLLFVL